MYRNQKIAAIVILLIISAKCIISARTVGAFTPFHIAEINQYFVSGEVPGMFLGGYTLYGILLVVLDLSLDNLMFYPLQLMSYLVVLWTLMRTISRSALFASLIVAAYFLSGVKATNTMFFGSHGMGELLIFLFLILLVVTLRSRRDRTYDMASTVTFLMIAITVPLFSYNRAVELMILTGLLWSLSILPWTRRNMDRNLSYLMIGSGLIVLLIQVGLFRFLSGRVVGLLLGISSQLGTVDKLVGYFFSTGSLPAGLAELYLTRPSSLTVLAGLKYAILVVILTIVVVTGFYRLYQYDRVNQGQLVVLSYVLAIGGFIMLRVMVGAIAVADLYMPALTAIAWLYQADISLPNVNVEVPTRALMSGVVVLLLIIAIAYNGIAVQAGLHNTYDNIQPEQQTSLWMSEYSTGEPIRTSQNIKGLLLMWMAGSEYNERYQQIRVLSPAEAVRITSGSSINDGDYLVLSYRYNVVTLKNWVDLRSWSYVEHQIDGNQNLHKIYASNGTEVSKQG